VEIRHYAYILWRRLWVVVLIFGIVLLYVGYQYYKLDKTPGALKAYQSVTTIQVGLQASASSNDNFYSDYQTTSEALADELVTGPVLTSPEFATQVTRQIQADTDQITRRFGAGANLGDWQDISAIGSSITATRSHTLVTISVTWSTPAGAWAIAHAIGEVSASQIGTYLDYEIRTTPTFSQAVVAARIISSASTPAAVAGTQSHKLTLLLLLLLVALLIGIALAFLIEALDDRLYSAEAAARLTGLPVIGEIPNRKAGS
jgi:capsular polysaccharide biosynthesis protein